MTALSLRSATKIAGDRQRVAMLAPRRLLFLPLFWRQQKGFVISLAGAVLTFWILRDYTYAPAKGWEWLVVLVQLVAVWGAYVTARGLATLQIEQAIVDEVEAKGTAFLRQLSAGQLSRIDLDELEQAILPHNKTDPPLAMIRLFQHIIKEARDRRFESSVNVMQPYREEPLDDLFQLQTLQKLALWGGILGTFIGLLLAMQAADLQGLLSESKFIELVAKMFDGMIVSFSASLAGLQVAVILGVFLLLLRRRQEPYFKNMETTVVTMLSLARNSLNKDSFIAELGQISHSVTTLTDRIHQQSRELTRTRQKIGEQTEAINVGMTGLTAASAAFDGFLQRIADAQGQFIGDIKNVYDMISLSRLGETVQASVGRAAGIMADEITASVSKIEERLRNFNTTVAELNAALLLQATESSETNKKLRDQITASTTESTAAIRSVVRQMQDVLVRESSATNTVRAEMVDLSRRVAELSRAIERIENLPPPRTRSVSGFLASLRW